jgi:hypothetical protein
VVRRFLTLAVVVGLAAGCSDGQGHASRVPVGSTVIVRQAKDGATIPARPGDTLRFVLSSKLDWRLASYPRNVMRVAISPSRGRFELTVLHPGAGKVVAVSRNGTKRFSVLVRSSWIP